MRLSLIAPLVVYVCRRTKTTEVRKGEEVVAETGDLVEGECPFEKLYGKPINLRAFGVNDVVARD